jgi:hypothetical protein
MMTQAEYESKIMEVQFELTQLQVEKQKLENELMRAEIRLRIASAKEVESRS